jgi:hypothetical protein
MNNQYVLNTQYVIDADNRCVPFNVYSPMTDSFIYGTLQACENDASIRGGSGINEPIINVINDGGFIRGVGDMDDNNQGYGNANFMDIGLMNGPYE